MQKTTPIKSAFKPLKPSASAMGAALSAAQAKAQSPSQPLPQASSLKQKGPAQTAPSPLPSKVEFWCEVVSRTDRSVASWSYFAGRPGDARAVVVTLNTEYPIVGRALESRDETLIALLLGLSLSETLLYRRRTNAWLETTFTQLRTVLFPDNPELREVFGIQFIGDALAASPPFRRIASELVKPGGCVVSQKHLIATINLETEQPTP